jgi:hypothetical protein
MKSSNEPVVVGFCGKKFNGKDTAAKALIDRYGFVKVSFADGLKQCVSVALRVPVEQLEDPKFKETIHEPSGRTYRWWLQQAGTEWFRSGWDAIWIAWWAAEIKAKGYTRVVTTDLRFPNEWVALRQQPNNMLFRVHNPRIPESGDTHASEAYAETFVVDHDINNSSTIDSLQLQIIAAVDARYGENLRLVA